MILDLFRTAAGIVAVLLLAGVYFTSLTRRLNRERALETRLLAALDACADEAPEFVAEARSLHLYLTTAGWTARVRTLADRADLPPHTRVAIDAAITDRTEAPA